MTVGNRFCILPMEGWDGTPQGEPSELTFRRWRHFGQSGAKLIWGGEAAAVRADGRANPNQLMVGDATLSSLERLRLALVAAHTEEFGARADADLLVGLQLTHSGRWAKPQRQGPARAPHRLRQPVLDRRFPRGRASSPTRSSTAWWTTSWRPRAAPWPRASTSWT